MLTLFISTHCPNILSGGVENVTFRLCENLQKRGHNVFSIGLDSIRLEGDCLWHHYELSDPGKDLIFTTNIINTNNINIIINQSELERANILVEGIKATISLNVKVIKTLHTDPYYAVKGLIDNEPDFINHGNLSRLLYKISPISLVRKYKRREYLSSRYTRWVGVYDRVVLLSHNDIEGFRRIATNSDSSKICAIGNPIDFPKEAKPIAKEKIVVYVGRLCREAKRPDRLLAVWTKIYNQFPDWTLVVVGEGPMRNDMETFCERTKLRNVIFVGKTDPHEYYRKASILCLTSTYEGFGLVCVEALVNGVVPVLFKSYKASTDFIDDGKNGLFVTPFKISEFAEKLSFLMGNPYALKKMRDNINSDPLFKENWSMETAVAKWETLFKELMI